MGFGDKFKDLTQQAKEKVAENRDKIQEAVDAAGVVANQKTHGKYANRITKLNEKTGSALDKFAADADPDASPEAAGPGVAGEAAAAPPPAPAPVAPSAAPTGDGPQFDE